MPAIITDQFRILNAETFAKSFTGIGTTTNYYYTFLGHPNPTFTSITDYGDANWGSINGTPAPKDHNAVANNSSDDNHDHNDEDDNSDHDHKDH